MPTELLLHADEIAAFQQAITALTFCDGVPNCQVP